MMNRLLLSAILLGTMMVPVLRGENNDDSSTTVPGPVSEAVLPGEPAPKVTMPVISPPVHGSLYVKTLNAMPAIPVGDGTKNTSAANSVSWITVPPTEPHKIRIHDVVHVIINETSSASSSSTSDSKKTQDFDLALQQFLELNRFAGTGGVGNVTNPGKLPEVKFKYSNDSKANADLTRKDDFSGSIGAEVIDVKPNGILVLQAQKIIGTDSEIQTFRLTGNCRAEDVSTNNSVLSNRLVNLKLTKNTAGDVKAGTERGWLNRFIDKVSPF